MAALHRTEGAVPAEFFMGDTHDADWMEVIMIEIIKNVILIIQDVSVHSNNSPIQLDICKSVCPIYVFHVHY